MTDRDIERLVDAYTQSTLRILVTGSRAWTDRAAILQALDLAAVGAGVAPGWVTVVHGAARGADRLAESAARELGMRTEAHPAAWRQYGRAAGPIRNYAMVGLGADLCLAWPLGASPGTRDCMSRCQVAGIPVRNLGDPDPAEQPDLFGAVS